jgi:maltooligosyltrehalose synthase
MALDIEHEDAPSRIPVSSYRLQFNPSFTFYDAAALVEYLVSLGVTECYTTSAGTTSSIPNWAARPGSTRS